MRIVTIVVAATLAASLSVTQACGKSKEGEGGAPAAQKSAAPASPPDYTAIDAQVKAARSGDDFTNLIVACGKLELEAATSGAELAVDATHREHCRYQPTRARAELAITESTPDKMSSHCLGASMGLDELVADGIHTDEARELQSKVKQSCGM